MDSNLLKQSEEIEALSAIYGNDWIIESHLTRTYNIRIKDDKKEAVLSVTFPEDYPSHSAPKYELSAPWMDRTSKFNLRRCLNEVYLENVGEAIVFQWVEKIREIIQSMKLKEVENSRIEQKIVEETLNISQLRINCPEITHGEVIMDRKSCFQAHAAVVHSIDDVNAVLEKLKENTKIFNATHNMYAYRISKETAKGTSILQDCDDDGESHAGGRMLHLLQILDQKNVVVVVSRWYGGIQLGPDRFRHINNATRQVLEQARLLKK